MNARTPVKAGALRCAIYTRKSSEEGLEQSFNSLHAQRQACEAYVLSQAGEGWNALASAYDDGGFSGGSMERPGLGALLTDVERGLVDVVVVYKVDRLTRSLNDFARIVETFDRCGVSFVSVTQAFNTTTSMGRLTLNVLLSFAQFEREVTGERIRDKIAMSKAKGLWMGGTLPLGYDLCDRTLVVNASEAETVRMMFTRYLALGSVKALGDELERTGVRSKAWTTRDGKPRGGGVFSRGALFHLLQSRLYLGEIPHKGQSHPGQHPAIVTAELFASVQARLEQNRVVRHKRKVRAAEAVLQGLVFDLDGRPMTPTFSYGKSGRLYRYYVSIELQTGRDPLPRPDAIRRVGAQALEAYLVKALQRLTDRPTLCTQDLSALITRVELRASDTHLVLAPEALFGCDHPELAYEDLQARLEPGERAVWDLTDTPRIRIAIPIRMQLRGGRTWISNGLPVATATTRINPGLVDALRSAHAELLGLNASPLTATGALVHAQAPPERHRRQLSRLPFLAPDLQRMILEGRQPERLTLRTLLKTELPLAWADQRAWVAGLARP